MRLNPLIPAGAGAVIDRTLARMRTEVCTVQRPAADRDVGGAYLGSSYGTVAVTGCRVGPVGTGRESVRAQREAANADYIVYVPRDVEVASSDRILVGDRTLNVVGDPDAVTFGTERQVLVTEER